jgi:phosphocarrier protein HPr
MVRVELFITNTLGLHARAAGKFVEAASRFDSDIWLVKGKNRVNGKSIMGILTMAAAKGDLVVMEIDGPDEEQALEALKELVRSGFGENKEKV